MEQKYYLPISSISLAHYFGCACIKPGKYFDNKPEDLQDKFNDFLLVTTHLGTQQADCCLELVFTEQEIDDYLIDIKNGFFLFEKPLPITRVRKIYFLNKEQKEQTIININMSTAFVPNELVEIKEFDNIQINNLEKPQDIHIISYEKQIQTFNNLLGGFALLKNAGEDYMNYSENYFSSLSTYLNIDFALSNKGKQLTNLFNDSLYKKIKPFLREKIDENTVREETQKEGQEFIKDKITQVIDLSKLKGLPFVLAVLYSYGVGKESKKKKIDDLILSNFHSQEIKSDCSEITALCYGLNRGYAVFSNSYKVGNNEKEVKFRLNSQLDYYTIESLYQYSFNLQEKNTDFKFLEWCPTYKNTFKAPKTNYQILDVVVIGKKKAKVGSVEWFQNLYSLFAEKIKNNLWDKGIKSIINELVDYVISDTKEELTEDFENQIAQKQEEIESLKTELETQKNISTKGYNQSEEQHIQIASEPQIPYLTKQDVKKIAEQVLKYKEKTKKMLENEAKERKISIPKGSKLDDIIILLVVPIDSNNTELFENE
jgi:hypothetical protein